LSVVGVVLAVIAGTAMAVAATGAATAGASRVGPVRTRNVCGAVVGRQARCNAVQVLNPDALTPFARGRFHPTTTTTPRTTTTTKATTTTTKATTTTTTGATSTTTTTAPSTSCPTNVPSGYAPCDLQAAYGLASSASGAGQTVAIVDAYNDPSAESDLAIYRSTYGLPACTTANGCFRKVNQNGGTAYPQSDPNWSGEISLDVDMVSAICPNCHILLVEASSSNLGNLFIAENEAAALGATEISNSWGAGDFNGESNYDSYFHHGIPITASTGDSGYGVSYPAASPYVTSVGGTSLTRASNARGWSETAWSGAGSGCSQYEPKPTWQTDSCGRTVGDVSADADPNTGVATYDSYGYGGWVVFGGTSVASPIIASIYALAGNGASISSPSYAYSHAGSLFDVTSGSNGSCGTYLCNAGAGYDGPTGLGTPNGTGAF
jgi:subtilase family serine protease